ncbi:MAG TPA: carboxypeptidase-like regulatory domain-containing protein, partial [Bacteroidota bacterium]|nr:carboxypeptidase-like regulatory domain-containing protein [Bacteroidota bacterium]
MNLKILVLSVVAALGSAGALGQIHTVSGVVRDSVTGEGLGATTVRVLGSPTGTISNARGFFKLSLADGRYDLVFSYVGYSADTARITLDRNIDLNVRLVPSPVQLAEVVVTGEDPAI